MNLTQLRTLNDITLWAIAEDNEDSSIRLDAFRHTKNWTKAEDDEDYDIRIEAYRNTGNWTKAENDEHSEVRHEAKQVLELQEQLNKINTKNAFKFIGHGNEAVRFKATKLLEQKG